MELAPWQTKLLEEWKDTSIEALLDEVLQLAAGDDYDGAAVCGWNEYQFMVQLLKERIGNSREDAYTDGWNDALRERLGE